MRLGCQLILNGVKQLFIKGFYFILFRLVPSLPRTGHIFTLPFLDDFLILVVFHLQQLLEVFDAVVALKWMAGVMFLRFDVFGAFTAVEIGMSLSALRLQRVEKRFLLM